MQMTTEVTKPKHYLSLGNFQYFSNSHPFAAETVEQPTHEFTAEPTPSPFAQFTDEPNPLHEAPAPDESLQPQGQGTDELGQAGTGEGEAQPTAEEQVQKLNFGGREVPVLDPIIQDLHKDYSELTKTFQSTHQENQQLAQEKAELLAQIQSYQQGQPQQQEPQTQENALTPERRKAINEEYYERMYEDKLAADEWLENLPEIKAEKQRKFDESVNAKVQEVLQPITEERKQQQAQMQMQEQIATLRQTYSDFEQMAPSIQELLSERPELADVPNALENLYFIAKGKNSHSTPTPESLLADPNFQQQILSNEQLQSEFLRQYQEKIKTQNGQLPSGIGRSSGTQTPMTAGRQSPRSIREASQLASAYFGE